MEEKIIKNEVLQVLISKIKKSASPYFTASHLYSLYEEIICKHIAKIEMYCGGSKRVEFEKLGEYLPSSKSIYSSVYNCCLEYESFLFTKVLVAKLHPRKKDETIVNYRFSSRQDHC